MKYAQNNVVCTMWRIRQDAVEMKCSNGRSEPARLSEGNLKILRKILSLGDVLLRCCLLRRYLSRSLYCQWE